MYNQNEYFAEAVLLTRKAKKVDKETKKRQVKLITDTCIECPRSTSSQILVSF